MASEELHEPAEALRPETIDYHRAVVSLMEELEAVDWYAQRVDATQDSELAAVLAHNRDEEKEHAAMVLEWLRRHDAEFDKQLRNYLFTDSPILEREEELEAAEADGSEGESGSRNDDSGSLDIGSLRGELHA
ncbi:MAG: encapsulin-associated ferritin-like protein [Thiohalobacteraceae bacterium]